MLAEDCLSSAVPFSIANPKHTQSLIHSCDHNHDRIISYTIDMRYSLGAIFGILFGSSKDR